MDHGGRSLIQNNKCKQKVFNIVQTQTISEVITSDVANELRQRINNLSYLLYQNVKAIYIRINEDTTNQTWFNENGVIMNPTNVDRGGIVSIQAIHYGVPDDRGMVNWRDVGGTTFNLENGYIRYMGKVNEYNLKSGDFRVIVLVHHLPRVSQTPLGIDNRPSHKEITHVTNERYTSQGLLLSSDERTELVKFSPW